VDIRYEFKVFIDIISSVVFINIYCSSSTKESLHDVRFEVDGEIFLSENDKRHIFRIDAVDLCKRFFLAFIISSDILR